MTDSVETISIPADEILAENAKKGDRASFEELVRRYQVPLLHFLLRGLGVSDAEDILQETFVRAFRRIELYNSQWRFKTWIFTIAHRMKINHFRKPWQGHENSEFLANLDDPRPQGDSLVAGERRERLWEIAKETLTQEQFAALWLFYAEELPAGQIAKILGRSWVSVKTMLHRARKRLKPVLVEKNQIENGEMP